MNNEPEGELISECCGMPALDDVQKVGGEMVGMCSDCHEHAIFTVEGEEED